MGGDGVKATIEVDVSNQQALDPGVIIHGLNSGPQLVHAALVQHLVRLDVHTPWMQAGLHRPMGLVPKHGVAPRHVPFGFQDPDLGISDRANQFQGLVF
jgi:hypothetical protein